MLSKLTKAVVTALVLSTTTVALTAGANAASYQAEQNWFDRATSGGAGHHTGDTNGF